MTVNQNVILPFQNLREDLIQSFTIVIASGLLFICALFIYINIIYFRQEKKRIREEEERILEELLLELERIKKYSKTKFTWTRCLLESCLLGKDLKYY